MSFLGEKRSPQPNQETRNIRNKAEQNEAREFYVDSGRELEVDDGIVRLEEHAVKAREFLAVNKVLSYASKTKSDDDDDSDNTDNPKSDKQVVKRTDQRQVKTVESEESLSGRASNKIKKQLESDNPDPEEIARALVEEAHSYKAKEEIVIESVSQNGQVETTYISQETEVEND